MNALARLPLTRRLALTFTAGALLLSTILAGSAYALTWRFLVREQERSSLQQAYVNASLARRELRTPEADVPQLLQSLTAIVPSTSVIDVRGRWYSSGLLVGRDALPLDLRTTAFSGSAATTWADIGGTGRLAVGIPLPEVGASYFEVFDVDALARTLDVLRAVLLVTAAATTAAGGATGWWASRRLAAPLGQVADAASRIARGDLTARLARPQDVELARVVDSFNTMVDTLAARIERDARFAGDVSHELRSPLTTLSTSLSVVQSRRDELSPRVQQALDLLSREVRRFEQLVEDLLEMARAESTAAEAEPFRPAELLLHLADRMGDAQLPLVISAEAGTAFVRGDKRRLEQALRNLVDNATNHGGGLREIRTRIVGPCLRIEVSDAGAGVPEADRQVIFERFARGQASRRRGAGSGTGLGLALVREHVQAQGGRVWVDDSAFGGARFVVELPLAGTEEVEA